MTQTNWHLFNLFSKHRNSFGEVRTRWINYNEHNIFHIFDLIILFIEKRYFKYILPNIKCCNIEFWFHIHRPLMMSVSLCSICSFVVILWDFNWMWISPRPSFEFVHSISGIVTVSLSVFQVAIGLFRPHKDSPCRGTFNIVHRLSGVTAFCCSSKNIFDASESRFML